MKPKLLKLWYSLRASYWFIPSLMTIGAIGLSFAATVLDAHLGAEWLRNVDFFYANRPEGARALLSTIAGSMITVAGVTFSITIAALAYATSQFGPRLLTNFMQDEGNQLTLGTFIATFIYCVLVLRTIRSPWEDGTGVSVEAFVPHVAILGALVFALASIGVFIYFIHHVPESIHASHVIAHIGEELRKRTDQLFPDPVGQNRAEADGSADELPDRFFADAVPVRARSSGYVQYVDLHHLLHVAHKHDLILRVEFRPGDFVAERRVLLYAWPGHRVDEALGRKLHDAFAWGRKRTQEQDPIFLVNELVEIAARALSPGVNDPFTAMGCLDWLGSALARLAQRSFPDSYRYDADGHLRVVARAIRFDEFANAAFDQLRPYAATDRNASLHMLKVIGEVGAGLENPAHRELLAAHATAVKETAEAALSQRRDLDALRHRYRVVLRLLQDPSTRTTLQDDTIWLSGSA